MADIQKIKVNGTEYDINLGSDKDVAVSSVKAGSITGDSSLYVGTTIRPSSGTITNLKVADNKITVEGIGAQDTVSADIIIEGNDEIIVNGNVKADNIIASDSISLAGSVITEWPSGGNSFTFISEDVDTTTDTGQVNIVGNNDTTLSEVNINDVITVDNEKSTFTSEAQTTRVSGTWVDTPAIKLNGVLRTNWPGISGDDDITVNNLVARDIITDNITANDSANIGTIALKSIIMNTGGYSGPWIRSEMNYDNNAGSIVVSGTNYTDLTRVVVDAPLRAIGLESNRIDSVETVDAVVINERFVVPSYDSTEYIKADKLNAGTICVTSNDSIYKLSMAYKEDSVHPNSYKPTITFSDGYVTRSYITGSNIVCNANNPNEGFSIIGSITIDGERNNINYPVTIKTDNHVYINGRITIDGNLNDTQYPITITSYSGIYISGTLKNSNNQCPAIAYVSTYTSGIESLADMIRNIEDRLATANI